MRMLVILIAIIISVFFDGTCGENQFSESFGKFTDGAKSMARHTFRVFIDKDFNPSDFDSLNDAYRYYSIEAHYHRRLDNDRMLYENMIRPMFCIYKKEKKCYNYMKNYLGLTENYDFGDLKVGPCVEKQITLGSYDETEVHRQYMFSCQLGDTISMITPVKGGAFVFEISKTNNNQAAVERYVKTKKQVKMIESGESE